MRARHAICTDEELALLAQGGEGDAEEALVERYRKVCRHEARSFRNVRSLDPEDRETECLVALVKAIRYYVAGRGTKFSSWAKQLMRKRLIEVYRSEQSESRYPDGEVLSLERSLAGTRDELTLGDTLGDGSDLDAVNERAHLKQALEWLGDSIDEDTIRGSSGQPVLMS